MIRGHVLVLMATRSGLRSCMRRFGFLMLTQLKPCSTARRCSRFSINENCRSLRRGEGDQREIGFLLEADLHPMVQSVQDKVMAKCCL